MELTAEELRKVLDYDPTTGLFTWKVKTCRKVVPGRVAGHKNRMGYVIIGLAGSEYYAHRIAWLWMTGEWPGIIDHRDGDTGNNAWANLRPATYQQNGLNARRACTNTSGYKGAYWHRAAKRWAAAITVMNRALHLGLFDTPEQAHAAYVSAAELIDPDFARAE